MLLEKENVLSYSAYMKYIKKKILILSLFLCFAPLFAQEYGTGAILDPELYEQTDAKPILLSRNYSSVPRSVSLKQYSPIPESQGSYGTCVGWATAFAARTISESLALARTDRTTSSSNAFSPAYIYKNISDNAGQNGANINKALKFMKRNGIVKRLPSERTMAFENIPLSIFDISRRYPIADFVRLFSNSRGVPGTVSQRVLPVKKSLAEGKPVIIGMNCPPSFYKAKNVWQPTEGPSRVYGGHAMCVVGYDDNMQGGAFEIQNSWGTDWGNGGYIWIRYEDFANWVGEAYEIIENLALYNNEIKYAASIKIDVYNDSRGMPVTFDRQGFYKTRLSYPSGTDFRFLMTIKHPAYVYAFSADSSTTGTERIFPLRGISPVLDYVDSTIAWPGEYDWIRLNDTVGIDYLIVLFSKEALDINAIERRFANEKGSFSERVARAVGVDFIPYAEVQYDNNTMEFSVKTTNPKAVLGLLLAIEHRAR
jgi:hypothetical protein